MVKLFGNLSELSSTNLAPFQHSQSMVSRSLVAEINNSMSSSPDVLTPQFHLHDSTWLWSLPSISWWDFVQWQKGGTVLEADCYCMSQWHRWDHLSDVKTNCTQLCTGHCQALSDIWLSSPLHWKHAHIIPIPKTVDLSDHNQFRTIFLLSKVLNRHVKIIARLGYEWILWISK